MTRSLISASIAASLLLGLSATATAHPSWLLPSHFTVSKEEGEWISFDVTASHTTFAFDKPLTAEPSFVLMPDGRKERPSAFFKGKRRSVFDFFFIEPGTHKIINPRTPFYMTSFKAGRRDTAKRMPANKAERAVKLPEAARDVKTMLIEARSESYVTVMAPNRTALEAKNKGFEMVPITHPADIIEQQPVTFSYLYDGAPVAGVSLTVTREGALYRSAQEEIKVETDSEGRATFSPLEPGRYIAATFHEHALADDPLADAHGTMLNVTFEVQLD